MKEQPKLGQLIIDIEQKDAIHVAILPATCKKGVRLKPGQDVGIVSYDAKSKSWVVGEDVEHAVGIVDPFLKLPHVNDKSWF